MQVETDARRRPGETGQPRLVWLDAARGIALLCMILFHFVRDLEMFRLLPPGTTLSGGWALFARLIAGTFILLSGVSFVLAHAGGFRTAAWLRRLLVIAAAASAVSAATLAAFPESFVYFGILHAIAAFLLLAPLLLSLPAWALSLAAMLVLVVDRLHSRSLFDTAWLGWTGLSVTARPAFDLIPVVPWIAAFLAGMAAARAVALDRFALPPGSGPVRLLSALGRRSLTVYLLHQPILVAVLWAVHWAVSRGMSP